MICEVRRRTAKPEDTGKQNVWKLAPARDRI
nr:MAG TPA: hypothetical protein [Caudoviricetes sp.]